MPGAFGKSGGFVRGAVALAAVVGVLPFRAGSGSTVELGAADIRRFALVAGNDTGGGDTRPLLFAREDARKIHEILTGIGGVRAGDATLLLDRSAEEFLRALTDIEHRADDAARRGERTALFVYYSGHAKDGALRMGDTRLGFSALKERLAKAPADVRVGIFDACQSGAMTRRKGARRAPEFEVQADASRGARGVVILTSSAADEDSQESDLLGGSYFSHHLASGLRGSADRSRDGRVTLSEAYAYAYERTLADTSLSAAGAQHPTYSYDFQGNGDLVLTDVADRNEGLVFPAQAPGGVYFVVDRRDFVIAEVWKADGIEQRVAVPPGAYKVSRRLERHLRVGEASVAAGRLTTVDESRWRDVAFADDPVKGPGRMRGGPWVTIGLGGGYQSFFDRASRESLFPSAPHFGLEADVRGFLRRDWVWGFDLAFGGGKRTLVLDELGGPLAYSYGQVITGTTISAEWPTGPWVPFVGGRLALVALSRDFDDPSLPSQTFTSVSPGLVAGLRVRFLPSFSLSARGRVHYLLYNVDTNRSLGYWELAASIGYEL